MHTLAHTNLKTLNYQEVEILVSIFCLTIHKYTTRYIQIFLQVISHLVYAKIIQKLII